MNDCEKLFLIAFGIVAASLQMIINIWEYSAAKREVAAGGDGDEDNKPVKRLHRGFQAASLVASAGCSFVAVLRQCWGRGRCWPTWASSFECCYTFD